LLTVLRARGIIVVVVSPSETDVEEPRNLAEAPAMVAGLTRFREKAGAGRGLYVPPWDPDANALPEPETPKILLTAAPGEPLERRVVLHEYAHHLLLSARFPTPLVRAGHLVFAGRIARWHQRALGASTPAITPSIWAEMGIPARRRYVEQFLERLHLSLVTARLAMEAEAEAFRFQIDYAEGTLDRCERDELFSAFEFVLSQFESQVGLGVPRPRVMPCVYKAHPLMRHLLSTAGEGSHQQWERKIEESCAALPQVIAPMRMFLEQHRNAVPGGCTPAVSGADNNSRARVLSSI